MSLKNTSTYHPAAAARIDSLGNILAVNEEWHVLAESGLILDELAQGVGLNYLEVCDNVTGLYAKYTQRAAQGIREVLSGERSQFSMDYSGNSQLPTKAQSVLLQVIPLAEENSQLLLLHTPITLPDQNRGKKLQRQKLASLGMLTTGITHDANNLLQLLSLQLAIIRRKLGADSSLIANVTSATQALGQLTSLAQQLRRYSNQGQKRPEALNLRKLIEDNHVIIQTSLGGGSVEFILETQPDLPRVFADRTDILQIILNIIMDAAEEGRERDLGQILLSMTSFENTGGDIKDLYSQRALPSGPYVRLLITNFDDETTIPPIHSTLDPFYFSQIEEYCLGITMISPLLQGLNGAIQISGHIDKGVQFYVYLPVHQE